MRTITMRTTATGTTTGMRTENVQACLGKLASA